jgi:AcrR family transcriptional regulator
MTNADDTRARIVAAAERLFAHQGVDETSLRAITKEAGVNVAAIHYHFGSRDELLREVLDRTIAPLNRRREEMLDAALVAHDGRPLPVEELLEAFLRPDLEALERLRDGSVEIALLIGRSYATPSPAVARFAGEQFRVFADRFRPEFERSLPDIDPGVVDFRLRCVVGVIVALFAGATPRGVPSPFGTEDIEAALDRLIAFLAPGLSAPAPRSRTPERVRRRARS